MNEQEETQELLVYNRATDCYEIRIQVPGELFRRRLIKEIEDNPAVDLTDPHTHAAFIARIGKLSVWFGRPHVKVLSPAPKQEEQKSEPPPPAVGGAEEQDTGLSVEEVLRAKARGIPPYQWEEILLTPLFDTMSRDEKQPIYKIRHKEHQIIDQLRTELAQGTFALSDEASAEQQAYEAKQNTSLVVKLETVAEAVNGNRFH